MTEKAGKIKVAVLGGGMAAMTAAFELTDPGLNDRYEVTVYQLGWRLGGKGASGRDMENHDRILEHGLHVWLGCYDNSFRVMRDCYAELGRSPEDPLGTVEQAFKPHSLVALEEFYIGQWLPWVFNFPADQLFPGAAKRLPSLWEFILKILEWIPDLLKPHLDTHFKDEAIPVPWEKPDWWDERLGSMDLGLPTGLRFVGHEPLYGALHLARSIDLMPGEKDADTHNKIHSLLGQFKALIRQHIQNHLSTNRELYHLWILLDLAISNVLGILADQLLFKSFDTINHLDYSEWLQYHGADQLTLDSAPVKILYELVFAYEDGVTQGGNVRRNLEAGTILQGLPRIALGYTGAFMWLMQAGMGDTVFAPLYQVLRRRGVRFEFFHRVTNLQVQNDELVGIEISRQVNLKVGEYDPLILVKGLPCWPSEPLYNQIVEGEALQRDQINLESFWTTWKDTGGTIQLKSAVDFDQVVLGISLAALPSICEPWIHDNPAWQAMISNIRTVQTQALQLWLSSSLEDLGCPTPQSVNGTFSCSPFDSWADMSHLISRENWQQGKVKTIAYFTGPMAGSLHFPPPGDHEFEKQAQDRVFQTASELTTNQLQALWTRFEWNALVAPEHIQGADRLKYQYMRANIDPTERYVQSVRNSSQYRLRSDQSGIKRLYLAGDWTKNGLNLGCVEAATTSGMQAAQAISGFPKIIIGDDPKSGNAVVIEPLTKNSSPTAKENGMASVYPKYVEHGGELSYPAPVVCEGTNLYGFILEGNHDRLTAFCRRVFRNPSNGKVDYLPLSRFVMLTMGKIRKIYSSSINVGWSPETQTIFWVPAVAVRQVGSAYIAERVAFLPAYVVVHDMYSLISGREVYGFFKSYGWIDVPDSDSVVNPEKLHLDVYGLKDFDPHNEAQRWPLLEVTRIGNAGGQTGPHWKSLEDAFHEIRAALQGAKSEILLPGLSLAPSLIHDLLHKEVPVAFLKQFRDAGSQGGAAYQAILEAPAVVNRLTGFRLIDEYQISLLNNLDSYPVAADLGVTSQKSLLSFKLDMDFTFEEGRVIWDANRLTGLLGILARLFGKH